MIKLVHHQITVGRSIWLVHKCYCYCFGCWKRITIIITSIEKANLINEGTTNKHWLNNTSITSIYLKAETMSFTRKVTCCTACSLTFFIILFFPHFFVYIIFRSLYQKLSLEQQIWGPIHVEDRCYYLYWGSFGWLIWSLLMV